MVILKRLVNLILGINLAMLAQGQAKASFELLSEIPESKLLEALEKLSDSKMVSLNSSKGVDIDVPAFLEKQYHLLVLPSSQVVVALKNQPLHPWTSLGIKPKDPSIAAMTHKEIGYSLGQSHPLTKKNVAVVGSSENMLSIYHKKFFGNEYLCKTGPRAFVWDRKLGIRNLSGAIRPEIEKVSPESLKLLDSVVLDHAFYVSEDQKTIVGVAYPKKAPFAKGYRFFKVELPFPCTALAGGRLATTLLVDPKDIKAEPLMPVINEQ